MNRPATGTKVKINMGDSVDPSWSVRGIVAGYDAINDELIVSTQDGKVNVAWPESAESLTVLDTDGWNREVCIDNIAKMPEATREFWQMLLDRIDSKPADERSKLYAEFIGAIVAAMQPFTR